MEVKKKKALKVADIVYIKVKRDFRGFNVGVRYHVNAAKFGGYYIKTKAGTKFHEAFIISQIKAGRLIVGVYGEADFGARKDHKQGVSEVQGTVPEMRSA